MEYPTKWSLIIGHFVEKTIKIYDAVFCYKSLCACIFTRNFKWLNKYEISFISKLSRLSIESDISLIDQFLSFLVVNHFFIHSVWDLKLLLYLDWYKWSFTLNSFQISFYTSLEIWLKFLSKCCFSNIIASRQFIKTRNNFF